MPRAKMETNFCNFHFEFGRKFVVPNFIPSTEEMVGCYRGKVNGQS